MSTQLTPEETMEMVKSLLGELADMTGNYADIDQIWDWQVKLYKDACVMKSDLEYFVQRVEEGSIRSKKTYDRFKDTLSDISI